MTVLEVIQRSTEFLSRKGVDSPRLQAELLLAHQLGLARMQLYLCFERTLATEELDAVRALVKRRGQREPLQQIVGSTSFCGLEIAINSSVLVPRPETELLAEAGWTFLNQAAANSPSPVRALDVGTGSGCLAIALAVKCPKAEVCAVDISPEAITLAQQNAVRHGVAERIRFSASDGFNALAAGSTFLLIISNPPYIPSNEIAKLQPEVRDHEPRQALDGGGDGLDFYRRLAGEGGHWLEGEGRFMGEFGDGQEQALETLFEGQNWVVEQIVRDYTRRPRILIAKPKRNEQKRS